MDNSLYKIIKNIQNGDNEKILDVIKKFKPLINKLNRKLSYEEAETDLIIAFIEMIKTINLDNFDVENEGKIISYINKVMKNKHIDLFRKYVQRHMETVELNLETVIITEECNIELKIFIEDILSKLTEIQRVILGVSPTFPTKPTLRNKIHDYFMIHPPLSYSELYIQ